MALVPNRDKAFIPEVWAARIEAHLFPNAVYQNLFNRNYEGEIRDKGDTVHIGMVGVPTIFDYECGKDLTAAETIETADTVLKVDQGKAFNFTVCDVVQVQSSANLLDEATRNAGEAFATVLDKYLGGVLSEGTATSGLGTKDAPLAVTKDTAYETLVKMKTALDLANVPTVGRKVVVPPQFEGLMMLNPAFYARVDTAAEGIAYPGNVYRAAGFDILVSNNCPASEAGAAKAWTQLIATTDASATLAQQITKVEAYRPESRFEDAVKGLYVYGAKLLHPERVAVATVSF